MRTLKQIACPETPDTSDFGNPGSPVVSNFVCAPEIVVGFIARIPEQ